MQLTITGTVVSTNTVKKTSQAGNEYSLTSVIVTTPESDTFEVQFYNNEQNPPAGAQVQCICKLESNFYQPSGKYYLNLSGQSLSIMGASPQAPANVHSHAPVQAAPAQAYAAPGTPPPPSTAYPQSPTQGTPPPPPSGDVPF